ncbi:hypothetical protein D1871_11020 [Nakamurella silvestris]|nr:hypothetical protein D1871_11020 [Nakamurella silvestris]
MTEPAPNDNPATRILKEAIHGFGRAGAIGKSVLADDEGRKHMAAYVVHLTESNGQAMVALLMNELHKVAPDRVATLAVIWSDLDLYNEVLWESTGDLAGELGVDWEAIEAEGRESWKPDRRIGSLTVEEANAAIRAAVETHGVQP